MRLRELLPFTSCQNCFWHISVNYKTKGKMWLKRFDFAIKHNDKIYAFRDVYIFLISVTILRQIWRLKKSAKQQHEKMREPGAISWSKLGGSPGRRHFYFLHLCTVQPPCMSCVCLYCFSWFLAFFDEIIELSC